MEELQDPQILRTVLQGLHIGICLEDRDRRIIFWNDGAERISGYRQHEVLGHFLRETILMPCNDQGCPLCSASCPFAQVLQDGKPREARIQARHKDGQRIPLRASLVPIRNARGSLIGIAASFDEQKFTSDRERRQHGLAAYGCLDLITGIPSHGFTEFHLRENLAGFVQYRLPFSILRIQVDRLQEFSSAYGREAADAILRVVAQSLQNNLRPSDFLGRWENDEFLAILMNAQGAGPMRAGERLRKVVECVELRWWGDQLSITVSIGHATAQSGDSPETLLERALQSREHSSPPRAAAGAAPTPHGSPDTSKS